MLTNEVPERELIRQCLVVLWLEDCFRCSATCKFWCSIWWRIELVCAAEVFPKKRFPNISFRWMFRKWDRHHCSREFRKFLHTNGLEYLDCLPVRRVQRRTQCLMFRSLRNTKSRRVLSTLRHFCLQIDYDCYPIDGKNHWYVRLHHSDLVLWALLRKHRSMAGRDCAIFYCRPPACGKIQLILHWGFWKVQWQFDGYFFWLEFPNLRKR